jgi:pseudouridine-5'-phosphate glycosidase
LHEGRPVVALESTIISHGMPYPRNVEVARAVEAEVRRGGAVPATCAVIHGVPTVGLSDDALELLARGGHAVAKASRRDLGAVMAGGGHGATTVAATMILAHRAGIATFATGGIGGVHRGAETSMDISADLLELARTPVTVVCAGVKSILDIEKTLEVLETQGVPVLGYQCTQFPAFFTNDSGVLSPAVVAGAMEVAQIMAAQEALGLGNGMVVGVPNPTPADAAAVAAAIDAALASAASEGIKGARTTPCAVCTRPFSKPITALCS